MKKQQSKLAVKSFKVAVLNSDTGHLVPFQRTVAQAVRKNPAWLEFFEAADGVSYLTHQGAAFRNTMIQKARAAGQRFVAGDINLLSAYRASTRKRKELMSLPESDLIVMHRIREFTTIQVPRGKFIMNYRVKGVSMDGDILLGGISGPQTERSTHVLSLAEFLSYARKKDFGAWKDSLLDLLAA